MKTGYLYNNGHNGERGWRYPVSFVFEEEKEGEHCFTAKDWHEAVAVDEEVQALADKYEDLDECNDEETEEMKALRRTLVHGVPAEDIWATQAPATFEDVKDCHAAGHMADFWFEIAERYFLEG